MKVAKAHKVHQRRATIRPANLLHWSKPVLEQPPSIRSSLLRIQQSTGYVQQIIRAAMERRPNGNMGTICRDVTAKIARDNEDIFREQARALISKRVKRPQGVTEEEIAFMLTLIAHRQEHAGRAASMLSAALGQAGIDGISYNDGTHPDAVWADNPLGSPDEAEAEDANQALHEDQALLPNG